MYVKQSIFGSQSEKKYYDSIHKVTNTLWSDYKLHSQLPIAAVIHNNDEIQNKETLSFFYKTSIDFVVCDLSGKPLIAIDYDGMGEGYGVNTYHHSQPTLDKYRKLKFDRKLQWAQNAGLPYYIVGTYEFTPVNKNIKETIVNELIGSVISQYQFTEKIPIIKKQLQYDKYIDTLSNYEQYMYVDDILFEAEWDEIIKYSPVLNEILNIRVGLSDIHGESWIYQIKDEYTFIQPHQMSHHVGKNVLSEIIACNVKLNIASLEINKTAYMRDLDNPSIICDITKLLAWVELEQLMQKQQNKTIRMF